jgi:hypothetical protein
VADPKNYRFKVTAADGSTASSQIFSWPPAGTAEVSGGVDAEGFDNSGAATSNLIDVAPSQDSAEVSAGPHEEDDHAEVTVSAEA